MNKLQSEIIHYIEASDLSSAVFALKQVPVFLHLHVSARMVQLTGEQSDPRSVQGDGHIGEILAAFHVPFTGGV